MRTAATAGVSTYQLYFDPSGGPAVVGVNETPVITFIGNSATDENNAVAALNALPTISVRAWLVSSSMIGMAWARTGANNFEYAFFAYDGTFSNDTSPPSPVATLVSGAP